MSGRGGFFLFLSIHTTVASQGKLLHVIKFMTLCAANVVKLRSNFRGNASPPPPPLRVTCHAPPPHSGRYRAHTETRLCGFGRLTTLSPDVPTEPRYPHSRDGDRLLPRGVGVELHCEGGPPVWYTPQQRTPLLASQQLNAGTSTSTPHPHSRTTSFRTTKMLSISQN